MTQFIAQGVKPMSSHNGLMDYRGGKMGLWLTDHIATPFQSNLLPSGRDLMQIIYDITNDMYSEVDLFIDSGVLVIMEPFRFDTIVDMIRTVAKKNIKLDVTIGSDPYGRLHPKLQKLHELVSSIKNRWTSLRVVNLNARDGRVNLNLLSDICAVVETANDENGSEVTYPRVPPGMNCSLAVCIDCMFCLTVQV
jgi:hypothetical protein